ncbi:MAG: hypothetical protein ACLR4A_00040 [Christensenellales bacterium]
MEDCNDTFFWNYDIYFRTFSVFSAREIPFFHFHFQGGCDMRKPHRKQLLAWLLTAALLLTNLPISVLSEEIIENPIQTEIVEQDESETVEEPNLSDSPAEETGEPTEPPFSEEPDETVESGEQSEITEIPADENTP